MRGQTDRFLSIYLRWHVWFEAGYGSATVPEKNLCQKRAARGTTGTESQGAVQTFRKQRKIITQIRSRSEIGFSTGESITYRDGVRRNLLILRSKTFLSDRLSGLSPSNF